jgi:Protein of unknown function (DUF3025)
MKPIPEWDRDALLNNRFFAPLHSFIARIETDDFPALQDCNGLLASRQPPIVVNNGERLHFVPQEYGKLPFAAQYEPRCFLKGEVPTRANNWHDLFNALVWLAFPAAKAAINARHYHALTGAANEGGTTKPGQRGTVRDTSTLLDESGVVVVCADIELAELLRNFQWKALFWERREQVQAGMGFYLFGHGLYEKALRPYIGMTGQGLLLTVVPEFFAWDMTRRLQHIDAMLTDYLSSAAHCISTRELTPVPLLGIPGWADENEHAAFYDNKDYFRESRRERSAS